MEDVGITIRTSTAVFPRLLLAGVLAFPEFALAVEPLTRIADIRGLERGEAAQALPVRVRGTITWRGGRKAFNIQDDTSGIWVDFAEGRRRSLWQGPEEILDQTLEGTEVEVTGWSDPGGYSPLIVPASVRILGRKPLPTALPMDPARFFNGADDCLRIEVRGVVQGFQNWGSDGWILLLDANPGRFGAHVSHAVVPDPAALVDSEVRLIGVGAARVNMRAEATGSRIRVSIPKDLIVEVPPPSPDVVPRVPLDRLQTFRSVPTGRHRVRVEGTVTFAIPGKFFYLQNKLTAVRVETSSHLLLRPGDRVEAAGFVDMSRYVGTLTDATVRQTGAAPLVEPMTIRPVEILALYDTALKTWQVRMDVDYDGHLIRTRARLLAVESGAGSGILGTLTLEQPVPGGQGTHIFQAILHAGEPGMLDALTPGSELEVTGLVQLAFSPTEAITLSSKSIPASLSMILRSAGDLKVLSEPSRWTARRFVAILAAVLLALGAALVWSVALKRQVRKKSRLLAREINARRDAAIEFRTTMRERNRLAANLHDTLPQTMSGLALQLDACEINLRHLGINELPPLEVARRMVEHAANELRGAVWEMRSLSLRGRSFPEALQAVVEQVSNGHPCEASVSVSGPLETIPDMVSGNLLLIVQEGLRNALQHGKPDHVTVRITSDAPDSPIRLEIRDDGRGFDPGHQRGPEQGHYGLVGMSERAERLGGYLRVESQPGVGTTIMAEVGRHDADDESRADETLPDPPISGNRHRG